MYIEQPEDGAQPIRISRTMWLLILGLLLAIVAGGLYVRPLAEAAESAAASIFVGA